MNNSRKGTLYVISGPSGTGKGTVIAEFLKKHEDDVFLSISATTRSPRNGEVDGRQYYFKTKEEFENLISEDGFLEWACFCGNYYGTPKKYVDDALNAGRDVFLEIEIQGAMKIMEKSIGAKFIFILPPSVAELRQRLEGRKTESADVIQKRMETAKKEIPYAEKYDYAVVNDNVEDAVFYIESILNAERCKNKLIEEVQEL